MVVVSEMLTPEIISVAPQFIDGYQMYRNDVYHNEQNFAATPSFSDVINLWRRTDKSYGSSERISRIVREAYRRESEVRVKNRCPPVRQSVSGYLKSKAPAILDFLNNADMSYLFAYKLRGRRKTVDILSKKGIGVSGSGVYLQDWLIQFDDEPVRFTSIAQNPNLIFWGADGKLSYFTILFSEGFRKDPGDNLVSLDFRRLAIDERGVTQLIEEEKNVLCVLSMEKPR